MTASPFQRIANALFPYHCVGCREPDTMFCPDCQAVSFAPAVSICPHCRGASATGGHLCRDCDNDSPLDGLITVSTYDHPITQAAIRTYKQRGVRALAEPLANLLHNGVAASMAPVATGIIIPVPLHPRRARRRGFDQSKLLAHRLGSRINRPVDDVVLRRNRPTPSQQNLPRPQRRRNVHGAFSASPAPPSPPPVLLIDDVMTTGATLEASAQTLTQSGWEDIWGLVVARAE